MGIFRYVGLAFSLVTGCALAQIPASPEITGKVINAATGHPIPDAIVVASIGGDGGSMFGHGHHRKLHCIAVRADALGRFRIPAWSWSARRSMSLDRFGANLVAYHPHYAFRRDGSASVHQPIRRIPLVGTLLKPAEVSIPMQRFEERDSREWGFKLGLPLDWFGCDWDADISGADLLWEAMREEVETFDAASPARPLKSKLELVTKRAPSSPPAIQPRPVEIQIRSPTDPGRSAPAR